MKRSIFTHIALGLFVAARLEGQIPDLTPEARQFAISRQVRIAGRNEPDGAARLKVTATGAIRHIASAPGFHFPADAGFEAQPVETARRFLLNNRRLFGIESPAIDLAPLRNRTHNQRTHVRLSQTYAGIPFFAAQAAVQIGSNGGVESAFSDLSRDVSDLDAGRLATRPTLTAETITARIRDLGNREAVGVLLTISVPRLTLFDPRVLGLEGKIRLVWDVSVRPERGATMNERMLIDAHNGEFVRRYAATHTALNREIHDAESDTKLPGKKIRDEGDPASGQPSVDNAYVFAGDTYNYYSNNHGRDSIDDDGMKLEVSVRVCSDKQCPWPNAAWDQNRELMIFGVGFVTDDIMGHELTHGVTDFESGLIYENTSGAINESMSDVFGEFIDLTNSSGADSSALRWLIGEDLSGGSIRNMQNPTTFGDPDRLSSSTYVAVASNPTQGNDFGGVHRNSGVNNKLAYLLTDGDTFNGQTIDGMGINRVSDLYYEANSHLLTPGAGWDDLFDALLQAAVNLGWSASEQNNLYRACLAVEIATGGRDVYVNRSGNCPIPSGDLVCAGIFGGPFSTMRTGLAGAHAGDTVRVFAGTYDEATSTSAIVFNKVMEIRAHEGTVTIK